MLKFNIFQITIIKLGNLTVEVVICNLGDGGHKTLDFNFTYLIILSITL